MQQLIHFICLCLISYNSMSMNYFRCPSTEELDGQVFIAYNSGIKKCGLAAVNIVMVNIYNPWFSVITTNMNSIMINQKKCLTMLKKYGNKSSTINSLTMKNKNIKFDSSLIQFYHPQWV